MARGRMTRRGRDWRRAAECGREDLNLHPFRDQDLNLARLPVPPRPHELATCVFILHDASSDLLPGESANHRGFAQAEPAEANRSPLPNKFMMPPWLAPVVCRCGDLWPEVVHLEAYVLPEETVRRAGDNAGLSADTAVGAASARSFLWSEVFR